MIRGGACRWVLSRKMEANETLLKSVTGLMTHRLPKGSGGIIGVSRDGCAVWDFNTIGMWRGWTNHWGTLEIGEVRAALVQMIADRFL